MYPSCTIVLPCYNEAARIETSLKELWAYISAHTERKWVLVCVDDGSTDNTKDVVAQFEKEKSMSEHVSFQFVPLAQNQGKGAAIQAGLQVSDTELYGYMDADLSIDYKQALPKVLQTLETNDIAIARRDTLRDKGYTRFRAIGSRLFRWYARHILRLPYQDIQCGFKWFTKNTRPLALGVSQPRFSFDIELLATAHKQQLSVAEVAVSWNHVDDSSVRLRDAVRYGLDLLLVTDSIQTRKWWNRVYLIAAGGISFFLYSVLIWKGYFFSDDLTWLWHGSRIADGELQVMTAHMSTFYSPVLNAFYAIWYTLFGLSSGMYFLVGILVHVGVSFLTGLITRTLTYSSLAGVLAVCLFAIAGGAYEPIVWIGANMHSIAVLFILLSGWLLLEAYRVKRSQLRIAGYLGLSWLSCILAFGTKEIAIVTPGVLFLMWVFLFRKKLIHTYNLFFLYAIGLVGATSIYAWFQYQWQLNSIWVQGGVLSPSLSSFLRIPILLFDIIVPLKWFLNDTTAALFFSLSLGFLCYILYRFRSHVAVWIGMLWAIGASLPVLFFNAQHWWEPLASRYTYHARVGIVIVIASIAVQVIRDNRYVRTAQRFTWFIWAIVLFQLVFMVRIVQTEYPYVYRSGRTLVSAIDSVGESFTDENARIFVESQRPFQGNHAHIVGAFDILLDIPEERIIFVEVHPEESPVAGDIVLSWDGRLVSYVVHFIDDVPL